MGRELAQRLRGQHKPNIVTGKIMSHMVSSPTQQSDETIALKAITKDLGAKMVILHSAISRRTQTFLLLIY